MEYHAEDVTSKDGADVGLVAGWFEWGGFGREEYEFDYGAESEKNDRAAEVKPRAVSWFLVDWGVGSGIGVMGSGTREVRWYDRVPVRYNLDVWN